MQILKSTMIFTIVIFYFSCSSNQTSNSNGNRGLDRNSTQQHQKSAAELREELKQQEQSDPKSYLSITAAKMTENITQKPDLFHHTKTDGWLLSGSITNTSTIAKFKDVVVVIKYFSETQTEMDSKEYVMYKYFEPNSVTPFEYKVYPPDGFKNFSVIFKTAASVN